MPADIVEMTTGDLDQTRDKLSEFYAVTRPIRYFSDGADFEFTLQARQVGELHGGRFRHTMPTRAEIAPVWQFLTATVLAGQTCWDSGGEQTLFRRGEVLRCPTVARSDTTRSGLSVALIGIPLAAVEQAAYAYDGTGPAGLRFHTLAAVSPAMGRRWRTLTGFAHRMLTTDGGMLDSPLAQAHLIDLIAATAFRQHYGTTPMGYLRQVRLDGAHRDLQATGSEGESVTAIAYRWGFSSPSRFAAYYRDAYGVLPSRTLRG